MACGHRVADNRCVTKGPAKRDVRITLRLPANLHAAIKQAAEDDRRSISDWLVVMAEAALREREPPAPAPALAKRR